LNWFRRRQWHTSSAQAIRRRLTEILWSITEEDCRDLMRPDAWAANTWTDSLPMFVGERNLAGARCRRRLSPGDSSWAVCSIHRGRSGAGGPAATRGSPVRARSCGGNAGTNTPSRLTWLLCQITSRGGGHATQFQDNFGQHLNGWVVAECWCCCANFVET
jgi:hypothetical protein